MIAWALIAGLLAWLACMGVLALAISYGALDRALDDLAAQQKRTRSFWKNFYAVTRRR